MEKGSSEQKNSIEELLKDVEESLEKIEKKYINIGDNIKTLLDELRTNYTPKNVTKLIELLSEKNIVERDLVKTMYFKLLIKENKDNIEVYNVKNIRKIKIYKIDSQGDYDEKTYFT